MTNSFLKQLGARIGCVIRGKDTAVKMAIVTLLAKGNLLIEDIPGVGKTTLAYAVARATDCTFHRIQFTSDMLPSDIIGVSIFNPEKREFEFKTGPVFCNVVLADEINRANPKTQSALLEAMNEKRVTAEKKTITLPEPFMVIATQNPIEHHGTFPLPESQLDRFMMRITLGYPSREYEKRAVLEEPGFQQLEKMEPVISRHDILRMQEEAERVTVEDSLVDYLMEIVGGTRRDNRVRLGASTRGAQYFVRAVRALAYYEGRGYAVPDDIRDLAPMLLGHRILLRADKFSRDAESIVREIVANVPVPA